MSTSEEDVLRFIAATFPSIWTLEVIILLRRDRRPWTPQELVIALRASDLVVSKSLHALVAAGLASFGGEGALYLPVSVEADDCVDRAEQLYRTRPNRVRRAIIAASTSSAAAFANAFKLHRGRDDH